MFIVFKLEEFVAACTTLTLSRYKYPLVNVKIIKISRSKVVGIEIQELQFQIFQGADILILALKPSEAMTWNWHVANEGWKV